MKKVLLTILLIIQCSILGATILNVPDSYATIQLAVDAAADGDTILVQPGTYQENILIREKVLTLGSLFLTTGDSSYIKQTIIAAIYPGRGITILGEGVQDVTLPVTICGFTITNGGGMNGGGAIWIERIFAVIRDNIIQDNFAIVGGGILMHNAEVCLEDNIILDNGDENGWTGALDSISSSITMRRCVISQNAAGNASGFVFWLGDFLIEDCTINNNISYNSSYCATVIMIKITKGIIRNSQISSNTGAGLYAGTSNIDFYNLLVSDNTSPGMGAIILDKGTDYSFVNCTIANNITAVDSGYGGGLTVGDETSASLTNCIFYGNSFRQIAQKGDIEIEYSDIQGGKDDILVESGTLTWGDGNIDADPLFVGTVPFPYALLPLSPCINAGTPDTTGLHLPLTDLAGHSRVLQGRIDMGAYEDSVYSIDPGASIDEGVSLYQNNPNPFRDGTEILFTVKDFSHIDDYSVSIYNTKGQLVRTFAGKSNTETTKIAWDGTDKFGKQTSPGVYLYKLEYGEQAVVRKMVKLH